MYARALFLFEFAGWAFVYCAYFTPLNCNTSHESLPPPVINDPALATLELPRQGAETYVSDILPLASIVCPVLLLPLPMLDRILEPDMHYPFWAHSHWADALLHTYAAV